MPVHPNKTDSLQKTRHQLLSGVKDEAIKVIMQAAQPDGVYLFPDNGDGDCFVDTNGQMHFDNGTSQPLQDCLVGAVVEYAWSATIKLAQNSLILAALNTNQDDSASFDV